MMELIADVPPMLTAAWLVWFVAGGMLAMWYRRASLELEFVPAPVARSVARSKPAARPSPKQTVVAPVDEMPAGLDENSHLFEAPLVAAREKTPMVIGDPFGDLATLLDQQPPAPAPPPAYRVPSDSPILSSSGAPMRRSNDQEPKLA